MDKLKYLALAALVFMMGATISCTDKKDKDKDEEKEEKVSKKAVALEDIKNPTLSDQVAYLLAYSDVTNFYFLSQDNESFQGDKAKDEFIDGYLAGLQAVTSKSEAYKRGYSLGVGNVASLNSYNKDYDLNIETKTIAQAFNYAMKDPAAAQNRYDSLYRQIGDELSNRYKRNNPLQEAVATDSAKVEQVETGPSSDYDYYDAPAKEAAVEADVKYDY